MTKEEILERWGNSVYEDITNQWIISAMQEFADQETERLKVELTELKEKHKSDVKTAYLNGVIDTCNGINIDSETYYKKNP